MKTVSVLLSILLLLPFSAPVRADFKYTEKSAVTGGALVGMAKFAAVFSKQSAKQALEPTITTRYVKGNRLRTDNPDGTIQIIDLDAREVIGIDTQKKTYTVITFEQLKAAMERAQQRMQQQMQQQTAKQPNQPQPQVTLTPKFQVLPGNGSSRVILGQNTTESKVRIDMEMTAQGQPAGQNGAAGAAPVSGQPTGPASMTTSMTVDTWVAPSVAGYQEFSQFYQRMAKEVNWVPPTGIRVADPRMTQGMAELQKNSAALKGLPLLSYISMFLAVPPGATQSAAPSAQNAPPPQNSSGPDSSESVPTSASGAVMKGLGGLFNKKKQKQQDSSGNQPGTGSAPPPGSSNANSLVDMTVEVTSFSDASLEGSVFGMPEGYTRVQPNPDEMFGGKAKQ